MAEAQKTCVWVGCPTSHGGVVLPVDNPIKCLSVFSVAKDGDLVSCPIHGSNRLIAQAINITMGTDKKYAVVEGCVSECGSVVMTPHDFIHPVTVKDHSEETDLKLMYPDPNVGAKISADATWTTSFIFNTNKHGPHEWDWHIHWKSSNPHGTHPTFEKKGVANTSDGKWDAISAIKNVGGTLDLTIKWKSKSLKVQIKIQGTNPTQDQIQDYLKGKENGDWLYQIIGQESNYHHFDSKHNNEPLTSFDNGFGLCQLTNPQPDYEHIWNWKLHLDFSIKHLESKKHMAKHHLSEFGRKYNDTQLKQETFSLWNGGFYYSWDEKNNVWKRRNFYCDTSTSNGGWNMNDIVNKGKNHSELNKDDRKFIGVCYADKILGSD